MQWWKRCANTIFPQNLAAAEFYFKAPFGVATIRGRLDFEGGVYRDRCACAYTASINKPICMHVKCACTYRYYCQALTMRRDFEGGVCWDKLADRCSDISRAAGSRGVARFRGNTVYATECQCRNCPINRFLIG